MRKIIDKLFFVIIISLFSLSLFSCSEDVKEPNYKVIKNENGDTRLLVQKENDHFLIEKISGEFLITDTLETTTKEIKIYSCLPDKIYFNEEYYWSKNGYNDLSDYTQELSLTIYRKIYVGEKKYLYDSIREEEIYSCQNTLDYFTNNTQLNDFNCSGIKLYEDKITKDNLDENYYKYGDYGTIEYVIVFRPIDSDYIKLLMSYSKYKEYNFFEDGDIINPYNESTFFYSELEFSVYIDYILDDDRIVFVKGNRS